MVSTSKSKEPQPAKKVNPVQEMEREQASLRTRINTERDRIQSLQGELATLLAMRAGASKHRRPLEEAAEKAVLEAREAQAALQRHLGGPNEANFADKLFEANLAKEAAETALREFDRRYEAREQEVELRTGIKLANESLQEMEQRQATLTHELDQAIAHATTQALVRVLSAYNDLYDVLSTDGPTIAKMRLTDPILYRKLLVDLCIEQDVLSRLILSDDPDQDYRPVLLERQQDIREMLLKLKRGL